MLEILRRVLWVTEEALVQAVKLVVDGEFYSSCKLQEKLEVVISLVDSNFLLLWIADKIFHDKVYLLTDEWVVQIYFFNQGEPNWSNDN